MKRIFFMMSILLSVSWNPSFANPESLGTTVSSAEFKLLSSLIGRWEGTQKVDNQEQKAFVEYSLTSNGTAITEKLFPGTPQEMITVYHENEKGKLTMIHHCMLGNQPKMDLIAASKTELAFSLSPESDIDVKKEDHMHGLNLRVESPNKLTAVWTVYKKGEESGTVTLTFNRMDPKLEMVDQTPKTEIQPPAPEIKKQEVKLPDIKQDKVDQQESEQLKDTSADNAQPEIIQQETEQEEVLEEEESNILEDEMPKAKLPSYKF